MRNVKDRIQREDKTTKKLTKFKSASGVTIWQDRVLSADFVQGKVGKSAITEQDS